MVFTESSQLIKKHSLSHFISIVFLLLFVFFQSYNLNFEKGQNQSSSENFYELNFEGDDNDNDDSNTFTLLLVSISHFSSVKLSDNKKSILQASLKFQYSSRAPPIT